MTESIPPPAPRPEAWVVVTLTDVGHGNCRIGNLVGVYSTPELAEHACGSSGHLVVPVVVDSPPPVCWNPTALPGSYFGIERRKPGSVA